MDGSPRTYKIKIGETIHNDPAKRRPVYFKLTPYGVTVVLSRSRSGKSALVKNIAYQISKTGRKLIIIDPFNEWEHIQEYNREAFSPRRIIGLTHIQNFTFKISQFDRIDYWYALGFSEKAGEFAFNLSQQTDIHHDDPDIFMDIVRRLPTSRKDLKEFNEEFKDVGLTLDAPLNIHTVNSIINHYPHLKEFFWHPHDKRLPIYDFKQLFLRSNVLLISLNIDRDDSFGKMRSTVVVAKILDEIGIDLIQKYHPIIISEESDFVVPDDTEIMFCISRNRFRQFARKFQKFLVHLIFINQDSSSMDTLIIRSAQQKILGILPPDDFAWRVSDVNEKYRKLIRKRRFLYIDEDNNAVVFDTDDCPVRC